MQTIIVKIKFVCFVLLVMTAGCQGEKTDSCQERYRRNPEAYHKAIEQMHERRMAIVNYRRFILIDPNFLGQENEGRN